MEMERGQIKFLLVGINAKYIHSNLAIYDLKAYAGKQEGRFQEGIDIAEYTINCSCAEIVKDIYLRQPDVVGISCYIWNIRLVEDVVSQLSSLLPDLEIWLGGPEVSYCARQVLERMPSLRGVMVGEGEKTFLQLLEHYIRKNRELSAVQNLLYRDENNIFSTQIGEPVALSKVPFPYKDMADFENRIVYYESSRGCPFSCSYCLSSVDKKLRFRELSMVEEELQFFLDHQVKQVKFVN